MILDRYLPDVRSALDHEQLLRLMAGASEERSQPLVMYDESYSVDVALEPQTEQATIVDAFMSADWE